MVFIIQIFRFFKFRTIVHVANLKSVMKYEVDKNTLNVDKRQEWLRYLAIAILPENESCFNRVMKIVA